MNLPNPYIFYNSPDRFSLPWVTYCDGIEAHGSTREGCESMFWSVWTERVKRASA